MQKFNKLKSIPAYLPIVNIDTDMIIPKQFLKTIKRSGLGKNLFHELRYDMQGNIKNDFVLNWDPYKEASILIAGDKIYSPKIFGRATTKITASEKSKTAVRLIEQPKAIKIQKNTLKMFSAHADSPTIYVQPFKP